MTATGVTRDVTGVTSDLQGHRSSCCIDPCVKMQGDPLRTDWLSGKTGMRRNSVRGEQIMPYLENKALIQKSKTIKFEILSRYAHSVLSGA